MIGEATLLGRVGKKEHKEVKNGVHMTTLSIATNRKYIDAKGQHQEITNWHNVNFFNKLAEIANSYAHVGDVIWIRGEISNKKIEDGQGNSRWVYSITGQKIQLIPQGKKTEHANDTPPAHHSNDNLDEFSDSEVPF